MYYGTYHKQIKIQNTSFQKKKYFCIVSEIQFSKNQIFVSIATLIIGVPSLFALYVFPKGIPFFIISQGIVIIFLIYVVLSSIKYYQVRTKLQIVYYSLILIYIIVFIYYVIVLTKINTTNQLNESKLVKDSLNIPNHENIDVSISPIIKKTENKPIASESNRIKIEEHSLKPKTEKKTVIKNKNTKEIYNGLEIIESTFLKNNLEYSIPHNKCFKATYYTSLPKSMTDNPKGSLKETIENIKLKLQKIIIKSNIKCSNNYFEIVNNYFEDDNKINCISVNINKMIIFA